MKKTFFYLILLALTLSCTNEEICRKKTFSFLKQSLNNERIKDFMDDEKFIVYPYFTEFGAKKWFLKTLNKKEKEIYLNSFLDSINYSELAFKKLKRDTDSLYLKKRCESLEELGNSKKSKTIVCFSGISERMFFVDIYNLRGDGATISEISESNVFNRDIVERLNFASYFVRIGECGKIKDVKIVLLSAT